MISNYQKLKNRWFGLLYGQGDEGHQFLMIYTMLFGRNARLHGVDSLHLLDMLQSREWQGMQYDPVNGDIYEFPVSD